MVQRYKDRMHLWKISYCSTGDNTGFDRGESSAVGECLQELSMQDDGPKSSDCFGLVFLVLSACHVLPSW